MGVGGGGGGTTKCLPFSCLGCITKLIMTVSRIKAKTVTLMYMARQIKTDQLNGAIKYSVHSRVVMSLRTDHLWKLQILLSGKKSYII